MFCREKRDDMKPEQFAEILKEAVTTGVQKALHETGILSANLTQAAAYRTYGSSNVDRWLREGLIRYQATNGGTSPKHFLDTKSLEAIAASSNRGTYLPVAER
jgi:hypothetical protein